MAAGAIQAHDSRQAVGATCVTFDGSGRVLLSQRRSPKRWELPGGLVESGESVIEAAQREVLEETEVHVEVIRLVSIYHHVSRSILALTFTARHMSGEPTPTPEASHVEWADVPQALLRLHPLYRMRLEDALAPSTYVRLHLHEGATILSTLPLAPEHDRSPVEHGRTKHSPSGAPELSRQHVREEVDAEHHT